MEKKIDSLLTYDQGFPFKVYATAVADEPLVAFIFFIILLLMGLDTQVGNFFVYLLLV